MSTRAHLARRPDDTRQQEAREAVRQVFVARQPIFDKRRKVQAYELLFRSGPENRAGVIDRNAAAATVLSQAMLTFGLETLIGRRKAFLNFTADHVVSGAAALVPREQGVIELLEDELPTDDLIEAMQRLAREGYALALDDFSYDPSLEPLLELAKYVKVSFRQSDSAEREDLARRLLGRGLLLLAEQVETREEYDEAVRLGYSYFQGYFFCKPEMISRRELKGTRLASVRLLEAIHRESLDYRHIEDIIKCDVALSHKFLRYLNSAWFAFQMRIDSIRHGLVLIGENDVRRWVSLMALGGLGDTKPQELVVQSAMRGHICEALAPHLRMPGKSFSLFLTGAFSLLEAMLDRPMKEALAEVPLPDEVEAALTADPLHPLRRVLDLVIAYEQGQWTEVTRLSDELSLDEATVPPIFLDAVTWTRETFG
jgi:EAL and modified HD-GYP domain-containing signal transduction protein